MNIINKIELLENLTANERILKDYILENTREIIYMSKEEVEKKLFISTSVIYRFCKKLSVGGYDHLRLLISQILLRNEKKIEVDFNFPFNKDDDLETICQNISSIYKVTIDNTYNTLDFQELKKAISYINRSKTVCLFTSYLGNEVANGFLDRIKDLNKKIKISSSPYDWKSDIYNLTKDDVVIINSYAGNTSKIFIDLLPKLKEKKIPIVLIASSHNQQFFKYASCKLLVCDKEDPVDKLHSYSSGISIQFIFDLLFSGLYQKDYDKNYKRRKYIYED